MSVMLLLGVCFMCVCFMFGFGVWLLSFGGFWLVLLLSFDGFNWFSPYVYGGISPYGGCTSHARWHSTTCITQHMSLELP